MSARFRCPECKQPLRSRHGDNSGKGRVLKCPECGARLAVPPARAWVAHPQIDSPSPAAADDGPDSPHRQDVVLPAMARSMPWIMSVFFHAAVALIFMLVATVLIVEEPEKSGVAPNVSPRDAIDVSRSVTQVPSRLVKSNRRPVLDKLRRESKLAEGAAPKDNSKIPLTDEVIGIGSLSDLGLGQTGTGVEGIGPGGGPGCELFPPPPPQGGVADVVFLIDRSGSMVDMFDTVRFQILSSVRNMGPTKHRFHVVLFSDGGPIEKTPRRMTPASDKAKLALLKFLDPVRASGKTDPIPAINRAFDVLGKSKGGVIHLLTDGVFPDNRAVLDAIDRRNAAGRIKINTILYGNRPPLAEKVMSKIARDNKGAYRYVSRDE